MQLILLCACSVAQACLTLCSPMDCSQPAPLSVGFSRHEEWSALPFPTPGNLPDPEIEPMSPASPALAGRVFTTVLPGKHYYYWALISKPCFKYLNIYYINNTHINIYYLYINKINIFV